MTHSNSFWGNFCLSSALLLSSQIPSPTAEQAVTDELPGNGKVSSSAVRLTEPWLARGNEIEAAYKAYWERLQRLYATLTAMLEKEALDLIPRLKKAEPKPVVHGYQVLPKLIPDEPKPSTPPRARVAVYSWPWTGAMIDREVKKIESLEADLSCMATLPPAEIRAVYERLVAAYAPLPESQRLIDSHIQYNRLWQKDIATRRAIYDRQTHLKDAVVERQAIRDALAVAEDSSFRKALESLPAGTIKLDLSMPRREVEIELRKREEALTREIHEATDQITLPRFLGVEQPSPRRWIISIPFYTDIEDKQFLKDFESAIVNTWRFVEDGEEYGVSLSFSHFSLRRLYQGADVRPPKKGEPIDLAKHCALFPDSAAVLTTGAISTHVTAGRCIVLGPHDIAPHVLAHEFGHILGFKDVYFRGYKDLGADGFAVEEVIAEPDDIMGAPGTGPVRSRHFERLIRSNR